VANLFKSFLRNLGYSKVYGPDDIPYIFTPRDLMLSFSGSGTAKLYTIKTAKKAGAKIVGWTSHPESELGSLSDYLFHIKGKSKIDYDDGFYDRQIMGTPFAPLTPLGTLFELGLLFTTLSLVGFIDKGTEVKEVYRRLCSLCKDYKTYTPDTSQLEKLYEIMPKPQSLETPHVNRKIVVVGEGFSGTVGEFFTTRLRHCAKEGEERNVSFYKDKGTVSVNKGDLVLVISGSATKQFYKPTKKVKDEKGVKVGLITSSPTKEWTEISDATVEIPGRIIEDLRGLRSSYFPRDPERSIFELRTLLTAETLIYAINQEENITEADLKNKHADFT